jgi:uncharacterized sporulation protein YeaH/YhbH (DUF444 family)
MAHIIIDRRKNDKGKSTDNRRRFVRRVKQQIKDAVKQLIVDGDIDTLVNKRDKKINIPGKGLKQPTFHHNKTGGISDRIYTGNKEFQQHDRIERPPTGEQDGHGEGSPDGIGEDEFSFHLTRDEFLDLFFEDLELPDMVKKNISKSEEFEHRRAGFSVDGNPACLNIVRSMKQSKGRRLGLRAPKKKKLAKLEEQLAELKTMMPFPPSVVSRINDLEEEIRALKKKIKSIPFIDDIDLRYNKWENIPVPTTQAVMFGIMDVSGSMGEWEKEMAKRFFMLLVLFLNRNYERVDIVWIRHHIQATEVDEEEFFHSKETGGTIVSSSLELMNDIIKARYPSKQWNIFGCQISDGDNWGEDSTYTSELMSVNILPVCQYFAYVEVDRFKNVSGSRSSDLWPYYEKLTHQFENMVTTIITDVTDIYPIFRKLFEKKS